MSTFKYSKVISMDKAAENCIKTSLKLSNSVMAMTGIAILMYSLWMLIVCLREYFKYPFSWFLWVCIFTGIIYCYLACIGHVAADLRNNHLLSLYIVCMFLLLLAEGLVAADICLNDKWKKDFPKDRTKRFDHFLDYVDNNSKNFKCLAVLIAFSQALSFFLAMVFRAMRLEPPRNDEDIDEEAILPFLDHHQIHAPLPYATFGHPDPLYYPPYTYGYGYASDVKGTEKGEYPPNVTGNEKGEYVAATLQAAAKGC